MNEQTQQADGAAIKSDGQQVVEGLTKLIEGKPVLAVATALVATLYAAATQESLEAPAREALSVMIADLAMNVTAANGISGERLAQIMAERSGVEVHASALGAVLLEQTPEQEQG